MGLIDSILGIGGKVLDRVLPNRAEEKKQEHERAMGQQATNTAEAQTSGSGGFVGVLKAWRGAVGWLMGIALCWQVVARPILSAIWPDVSWAGYAVKDIELIARILLGMLGLGG